MWKQRHWQWRWEWTESKGLMCMDLAQSRGKGLCHWNEVLLERVWAPLWEGMGRGSLPRITALKFRHFSWYFWDSLLYMMSSLFPCWPTSKLAQTLTGWAAWQYPRANVLYKHLFFCFCYYSIPVQLVFLFLSTFPSY